jgi:hypothetical protein
MIEMKSTKGAGPETTTAGNGSSFKLCGLQTLEKYGGEAGFEAPVQL